MRERFKGFTLIELMVTVVVMGILAVVAIPSFISSINNARADSESGELYRSLNFARLEAINRGVSIRLVPAVANTWTSAITVQVSGSSPVQTLRATSAMADAAVITPSTAASIIEFNNLGALTFPATAVTLAYKRGTYTRNIAICVTGRVVLGGTCP